MTVQAQEVITYREKNFSLIGAPLNSFLEQNKQIKFDIYSTAHWRGYQGFWLLKNDNLYITNLESSNHTFIEIFNTNEPVLADWFSGIIQFGFGDFHHDHWWGHYDNYLWLKLENGKVVDKKIGQDFNIDNPISFGKYKGKNLEDILYGKIRNNTYTTIKNLIDCVMCFMVQKDFQFKVQCGHFKVEQEDIDLVRKIREYGVDYFLTQNYIATSTKVFWENSNDDDLAEKLSLLLEKMFQADFFLPFTLTKETLEPNTEIAENSLLINPDISYLNWALINVDFFTISPITLNETIRIKRIKSFKTNRLNKTVFEYEPLIENIDYKFPEQTQRLNLQKFEKENNVTLDDENRLLIPNLANDEMMLKYGFYLDETYLELIANGNDYDEYNYQDNYYNSNDLLIDAAGTNDPETMNDVYWNLD